MRKIHKQRHYILHTATHLLTVFLMLAGAVFGAHQMSGTMTLLTDNEVLSPSSATSPSTPSRDTASVVTAIASTTDSPISFSVTPAPETDCSDALHPLTKVFFAVSSAFGGSFVVSSDSGMTNARLEWGEYPLPNGVYSWKGIPNTGFLLVGNDSGTFELRSSCASTGSSLSETKAEWTTNTLGTLLNYSETSLVTPRIFLGASPLEDGGTVSGDATFIASAFNASRVRFALLNLQLGVKLFAEAQGVVHESGGAVWKFGWGSASVPDGDYALLALVDTTEGTAKTVKVSFKVHNTSASLGGGTTVLPIAPTTASATVPALTAMTNPPSIETPLLPRPVLKVFVDNKAVTDPSRTWNDEDIEFRVVAPLVKKVTFVAVDGTTHTATQLGNGVIDDLLTNPGIEVWTYLWSARNVGEGTYKIIARVLRTDGTTDETMPISVRIHHEVSMQETPEKSDNITSVKVSATPEERAQILARISDPASCTNAEECRIFCESNTDVGAQCINFARKSVPLHEGAAPSLADDVPSSRIALMLADPLKRPKELPEFVENPSQFLSYCAQEAHSDVCNKALLRNDLSSLEMLAEKTANMKSAQQEVQQLFIERSGARAFVDTDHDGVTDYDEINIYHTDPNNTDTDYDGFSDGVEILARTNPLGVKHSSSTNPLESSTSSSVFSPVASEEVSTENPLVAGSVDAQLLVVSGVVGEDIGVNAEGATTAKKLAFSGKSLPNSFVTLFIYSDPIVVTVKTDESGSWTYTLDKELPDGAHQVVSAITDSGGRILAKSEPLPFVKEAAAVSFGSATLLSAQDAPSFFSGASLYALIAILIAVIGAVFSLLGFMAHHKKEDEVPPMGAA